MVNFIKVDHEDETGLEQGAKSFMDGFGGGCASKNMHVRLRMCVHFHYHI